MTVLSIRDALATHAEALKLREARKLPAIRARETGADR